MGSGNVDWNREWKEKFYRGEVWFACACNVRLLMKELCTGTSKPWDRHWDQKPKFYFLVSY